MLGHKIHREYQYDFSSRLAYQVLRLLTPVSFMSTHVIIKLIGVRQNI
jgi:hypothetical protein